MGQNLTLELLAEEEPALSWHAEVALRVGGWDSGLSRMPPGRARQWRASRKEPVRTGPRKRTLACH